MLRMAWVEMLEPKMNEPTGQLDKSLVKVIIRMPLSLTKPEIFQHIVCLIITPGIETLDVSCKVGLQLLIWHGLQSLHKGSNTI